MSLLSWIWRRGKRKERDRVDLHFVEKQNLGGLVSPGNYKIEGDRSAAAPRLTMTFAFTTVFCPQCGVPIALPQRTRPGAASKVWMGVSCPENCCDKTWTFEAIPGLEPWNVTDNTEV